MKTEEKLVELAKSSHSFFVNLKVFQSTFLQAISKVKVKHRSYYHCGKISIPVEIEVPITKAEAGLLLWLPGST